MMRRNAPPHAEEDGQTHQTPPSKRNKRNKKPKFNPLRYKIALCRNERQENMTCTMEYICDFAHNDMELRTKAINELLGFKYSAALDEHKKYLKDNLQTVMASTTTTLPVDEDLRTACIRMHPSLHPDEVCSLMQHLVDTGKLDKSPTDDNENENYNDDDNKHLDVAPHATGAPVAAPGEDEVADFHSFEDQASTVAAAEGPYQHHPHSYYPQNEYSGAYVVERYDETGNATMTNTLETSFAPPCHCTVCTYDVALGESDIRYFAKYYVDMYQYHCRCDQCREAHDWYVHISYA